MGFRIVVLMLAEFDIGEEVREGIEGNHGSGGGKIIMLIMASEITSVKYFALSYLPNLQVY